MSVRPSSLLVANVLSYLNNDRNGYDKLRINPTTQFPTPEGERNAEKETNTKKNGRKMC